MSMRVLQPAACSGGCGRCSKALSSVERCNARTKCAGYGSSVKCPPMIVLAVIESAARMLEVAR